MDSKSNRMKDILNRLDIFLEYGENYFLKATEAEISRKSNPAKWSKKEILGHLIDSGVNNLQRFTAIQFADKPYKIRAYNQTGLVKANDYQNARIEEMINFWLAINQRIKNVIKLQREETLQFEVELKSGEISDLKFLIVDYVDHMEHHMKQLDWK